MQSKNNWKAWLYLAPVLILMAVFTFYPLISTIGISFLDNYDYLTGANDGITLFNYGYVLGIVPKEIFGHTEYFTDVIQYAIPNTLILVFVTVPISIILSLLIAVGLNSIKFFKRIFQTIFFLPYVTNAIAVGMVFAVIFDGYGLWNTLFGFAQPFEWISSTVEHQTTYFRAMFALCVYIIWGSLPFKILIFLSGLQNIDKQYYQAAQIDAASKFKVFTRITVPLLSPQILYSLITSFIGAFKEYDSVVGLFGKPGITNGEDDMLTVVYYIYNQIADGKVQYGAATAVLLFVVILTFTLVQLQVAKRRVHY